jgi:hypothetical protein
MYHMLYKKLMRKRAVNTANSHRESVSHSGMVAPVSSRPTQALPALEALSAYPTSKANNANADLEQRVREADDVNKPVNKYDPAAAAPVPSKYNALAPLNVAPGNNGQGQVPNPALHLVVGNNPADNKTGAPTSPFSAQFTQQQPSLPPNTTRQQVVALPGKSPPVNVLNPYQQPQQVIVHPSGYHVNGDIGGGIHLPDRNEARAHSAGSANGTRSGGFRGIRVVKQPVQLLPKQGSNGSTTTASSVQSPYVPKLNLPTSGSGSSHSHNTRAAYINDLSDRVASAGHSPNVVVSQTARDPPEPVDPTIAPAKQQPLTARAPAAPVPSSSSGGRGGRPVITGGHNSNVRNENAALNSVGTKIDASKDNSAPARSNNQEDTAVRVKEPNPRIAAPLSVEIVVAPNQDVAQRVGSDVGGMPVVVSPMLAEVLGINPEDIERPSTRRSHMRSRGGESRENDARPQSGMGDDGMSSLNAAAQTIGVAPMGIGRGAPSGGSSAAPNGVAAINSVGPVKVSGFPQSNGTDLVSQWQSRQPERPPIVRPPSSSASGGAQVVATRPAEPVCRPTGSASGGRRGRNISNAIPVPV